MRTGVVEILRRGFGATVEQLSHEVRLPEVRGRVDTIFGATVFEYKSDLRAEEGDVLARLPDYLGERERQTGRRYLGVATDGAEWRAYELRDGALHEVVRRLRLDAGEPDALIGWLEPALADRDDLAPEPAAVQGALGRYSFVFGYASSALARLWERYRTNPEAALKRDLWDALLREVYGTPVGDDALFLQHTYLTIVAKTIAASVLDVAADDAAAVLSGKLPAENGIFGAVESDFFDWVLLDPDGADLVLRLARQAARFRLRDVQSDVLKALYESLIDPAQRQELGEYYTPDWLAAKVVARAVERPLQQRVLDPACGSGTFLFHAVRRLRAAASAAGLPAADRVRLCAAKVRGLDVHPVAAIIARVTWLLALGEDVQARQGELNVPVYLGDAMQWNVRRVADVLDVEVVVPGEAPLRVPTGFAESQERLDAGIRELDEGARTGRSVEAVERALRRIPGAVEADVAELGRTYAHLRALFEAGRDGIWPFVLRNLVRPVWLSRPDQRADVLVGNPPWVAYRNLSDDQHLRADRAARRGGGDAGGSGTPGRHPAAAGCHGSRGGPGADARGGAADAHAGGGFSVSGEVHEWRKHFPAPVLSGDTGGGRAPGRERGGAPRARARWKAGQAPVERRGAAARRGVTASGLAARMDRLVALLLDGASGAITPPDAAAPPPPPATPPPPPDAP